MYYHIATSYNAPTEKDFTLEIISKRPDTFNKKLVQHDVQFEAMPTIGVKDLEAFEVHFSNNSIEDCQVRISLDGVDVFNAKPASLEVNNDMWVVRAGKTLHLRAWHETNAGGSQLVFTTGDKSVSYHTGGNPLHKGVIAAAVYTERNRPIRYYQPQPIYTLGSVGGMRVNSQLRGEMKNFSDVYSSSAAAGAVESASFNETTLQKTAMVGAGEYVEQKTHTTTGLTEPILNHVKQIKYLFWEELEAKMMKQSQSKLISVLGFPENEKIKTFANIDNVPKVSVPKSRTWNDVLNRVKNIW